MQAKMTLSQGFIHGFSEGINLYGQTIHLDADNSSQKDYEALRKDWEDVGTSIKEATKKCSTF